jgi:tetratricopeptide (TPR) repeat protein
MKAGTLLGAYRIESELGSGGMGKVYAATVVGRAPGLAEGERVALKVVHPHLLEAEGFFMRFMREASLGASIRHENVVRTHMADALVADGRQHNFLVMEYVEGQSLRELLRELETLPEDLCRHVAMAAFKGLAAIHEAGIVHRDLKPENVLITEDHHVKVMDLGVARLADEALRLSQSGAFVGSVEYAAPEQFTKQGVDARCDLHALGLVLYELACGQHPYRGDDFRGVMKRVCEEAPRRLGEIQPQLTPYFEEVVHTLLAKDRDERFGSAAEVLGVLEEGESSAWWQERANEMRASTRRPLRRIRVPRETAVYGREDELGKMVQAFDRAKSGDGNVILIEGEAGIGKSRLVDELVGRLQQRGDDVTFVFGSYPPGGAATASGAFSTAFREQLGSDGSAAYLTATPILVPAFDALLRGESPPTGEEHLTKDSLQTCFVNVTRGLAAENPTIVLIDDLHFAPGEGRALFSALAMAVEGHCVLLIGTTRPGVSDDWIAGLTRLEQTDQMELSRLGPKDIVGLLQDAFGSKALAESLGLQIVLKSDGNPFFAFEIIRGLREGQFITQGSDGTWVSTRVIDAIQIPSSVLDLVNARVADLTEEERELLDVAACWGFEFDATLVGDCLGRARIPTLRQLALIEKKHRLVRCSGEHFVFDHHQVQEALYGALPPQLAREYHGGLAEALEQRSGARDTDVEDLDGGLCVDLCEHFLKSSSQRPAVRYLQQALRHLGEGYLHAEVVALSERALSAPGLLGGPDRARALLKASYALEMVGDKARVLDHTEEALRLAEDAGDPALLRRAVGRHGGALRDASRAVEAEAAFRRQHDLAEEAGELSARIGALIGLEGVLLGQRDRYDELRALISERHGLARELGTGYGLGTINLGNVASAEGALHEARELYARAVEHNVQQAVPLNEAVARHNLGWALLALGLPNQAVAEHELALGLYRSRGHRRREAGVLVELAFALWNAGDDERATEVATAGLTLGRELDDAYALAQGHLLIGELRSSDDAESARVALEAAREAAAARESLWYLDVHATCALAILDPDMVDEALDSFRDRADELSPANRVAAAFHLFRATGDGAHIELAKSVLDQWIAGVAVEYHAGMRENVRRNRQVLAAWSGDEPRGTESVTRAGSD